jgi:serine/threonine-protein kinase HipA
MLPDRVRAFNVSIGDAPSGQLLKHSVYEYRYASAAPDQTPIALLMNPALRPTWQDGDLFPVMDQHLPEGDLFMRLRSLFPKQALTPMHLLALVGANGIGRLGYTLPDAPPTPAWPPTNTCA